MKITVIALSHKIEPWAQQAVDQFQKRFPGDWKLSIKELKPEDRSGGKPVEHLLAKEAERIRAAIPAGSLVVALDERGERLTSKALSDQLLKWHNASENLCLLIALLILTGCANSTPPSRPPIPANLSSPCPAIESFASQSWDDLMQSYMKMVIQYSECANKHDAIVDACLKLFKEKHYQLPEN